MDRTHDFQPGDKISPNIASLFPKPNHLIFGSKFNQNNRDRPDETGGAGSDNLG